jgi:hypothetical protein
MMTLDFIGTLFPAIPLAIVALNLRYTSLAGLMRNLAAQIEKPEQTSEQTATLFRELQMMQLRISLVKFSLFFAGLSFVFNLGSMYLTLYAYDLSAHYMMGATIMMMMAAIGLFCVETIYSTRALKLHLEIVKPEIRTSIQTHTAR